MAERGRWLDALVALVCLTLALLALGGRWRGECPFLDLDGDSAQLASFAAARLEPQAFVGDALLADPANFAFYATVQIPVAQLLQRLTGDFGSAVLIPLGPVVFLQLLGFYVLGCVLLRQRYLALLLSLSTLPIVSIPGIGTQWGQPGTAQAREWFQALLPFLLAAALQLRSRPRGWPVLMFAVGLMVYVHPVSTPAWAVALWSGFWVSLPRGWSVWRRLRWLSVCGAACALASLPFGVHYLDTHVAGATLDYDAVSRAIRYRFTPGFSDLPGTVVQLIHTLASQGLLWLAPVAAAIVWRLDRDERPRLATIGAWTAALVLVSVVVPLVEHALAASQRRIPFEYDLIRSSRYLFPLAHLVCLWALAVLARRLGGARGTALLVLAGTLFLAVVAWRNPLSPVFGRGVEQLLQRSWDRPAFGSQRRAALTAAREQTLPGSKFFANGTKDGLALRYFAMRPVVYNFKDGASFVYSNHARLLEWHALAQRVQRINRMRDPRQNLAALVDLARELDADYMLLARPLTPQAASRNGAAVLLSNERYSVVSLKPDAHARRPGYGSSAVRAAPERAARERDGVGREPRYGSAEHGGQD